MSNVRFSQFAPNGVIFVNNPAWTTSTSHPGCADVTDPTARTTWW